MKIWVLLPAYNEAESFPRLFPKIADVMKRNELDYEIVVCNDGSVDGSAEILSEQKKRLPLSVVTHDINRGLGETERDLFEYVARNGEGGDIAVRLDCDDTHEPEFILSMIAKVIDGNDVVIASRFAPGGGQVGVSGYRAFISYCANVYMKMMFYIPNVREFSCGFRAYRVETLQRAIKIFGNDFIQLKGLGFTCTLETLVKLKLIGARFAECPFVLRYDQKASESKMVSSVTTVGYLMMGVLYHWPWGGWKSQIAGRIKRTGLQAAIISSNSEYVSPQP